MLLNYDEEDEEYYEAQEIKIMTNEIESNAKSTKHLKIEEEKIKGAEKSYQITKKSDPREKKEVDEENDCNVLDSSNSIWLAKLAINLNKEKY